MLRSDGFSIIELTLVVVIIGIVAAIAIPNYIAMQARAKEAAVMEVAHTVQMAAENYAASSEGIYSHLAVDLTPLLPGGMLVKNPFTGQRTEPQFGVSAATPGQVGIVTVIRHGAAVGYTISGWGRSEQILTYTNGT